MKNYLVYVRVSADKQTPEDLSIPEQIEMMEEYAKYRRWKVVGYVADEDEPVDCADEARFKNLRRYLEKHNDIDVVVTAEIQPLSSADCAAIKALLNQKGIKLTRIPIRQEEDESTDDLPATKQRSLAMTNLFHTPELYNQLRDVLAQSLPSMLKVYSELKRRTDLCNGPLIVSIKELAQYLGLDTHDLRSTLFDLVNVHVIDFHAKNLRDDKWTIILLVH